MKEILNFIKRRFPVDCNWTTGNCYYFSLILCNRFGGEICYDTINGHFFAHIGENFYDWNGIYVPLSYIIWKNYNKNDPLHFARIVRDVIN